MEAGRKLDALIAEKVMGITNDGKLELWVPSYSVAAGDAMEIIEMFAEKGYNFELMPFKGTKWRVFIGGHEADGDTLAHAICLAALKTLKK